MDEINNLKEDNLKYEAIIKNIEKEVDIQIKKNEELSQQNSKNKQKINYLEDENKKLKETKSKEFEELTNINNKIKIEYEKIINEKSDLDKKCIEYKNQINENNAKIDSLNQDKLENEKIIH